ncbi:uncharacterized protein BT62DRAFT_924065 [Guyanagaster necrorhizus]|uniref:Uncharacterized protein n=1 Tax=Guyanagaster necrorhizus TaxID=856835 RepID=A0A9P7VH07_9AGAR|nr:uncharacterized protein BT62DRAFT_924065 [Guyanagaster necrorhizus MCA 3950]KAG7440395.1 hypothetical protein BT62DRAFT_924065 [Guyanagaster necrorhizus MCA 3950]
MEEGSLLNLPRIPTSNPDSTDTLVEEEKAKYGKQWGSELDEEHRQLARIGQPTEWGPAPKAREHRRWLSGTEWNENPKDDPYTPDRWDNLRDDQDRSTKWNEDPKDDPYEVDQWDDTTNEGEGGPDGPLSNDESFDWTIKAKIPPQPSLRISNQTLQGFLHKKLTTLFLNSGFYQEFQNYTG